MKKTISFAILFCLSFFNVYGMGRQVTREEMLQHAESLLRQKNQEDLEDLQNHINDLQKKIDQNVSESNDILFSDLDQGAKDTLRNRLATQRIKWREDRDIAKTKAQALEKQIKDVEQKLISELDTQFESDEEESDEEEYESEEEFEPEEEEEYQIVRPVYKSLEEKQQDELRERITQAREESEAKTKKALARATEEGRARVERDEELSAIRDEEFERMNEDQKRRLEQEELEKQKELAKAISEILPVEENPEKMDELKNRIQEIKDLRTKLTDVWGEFSEEYGTVKNLNPQDDKLGKIYNELSDIIQQIKLGERQQKHFEENIKYLEKKLELMDLLRALRKTLVNLKAVI